MRREGPGAARELEEELHGKSAGMCREVVGLLFNAGGASVPDDFARDGESPAGTRGRDVLTLFGRVRVEGRSYYRNPGKKTGRFPADDAFGLVGGCTPALAKRALEHALKEPYAAAAESFGKAHTRELTADVLKQLARAVADDAGHFAREGAPDAPGARPVPCAVVMGDGTGMPMRPEELAGVKGKALDGTARTREAKVGAVFEMTPAPGDPAARARVPGSTTYTATLERKEDFARGLRAEFDRRFAVPPEATLFIGDGAKWLWDIQRTRFPFAVGILDFYHAAEHLAPLLDLAGLQGGERKATRKKWKRWLIEGNAEKLVSACENLAQSAAPGKAQEWRKALQYYRDNLRRMRYDEYLAKGWFIGSGVVEGACKTLICERFKRSGMRWSRAGADALLPLRTACISGRYDELWKFILERRKKMAATA